MPTIEFRTFHDKSHDLFRPVAAKDLQPDWWRKMKIRVDHRGRVVQTFFPRDRSFHLPGDVVLIVLATEREVARQ